MKILFLAVVPVMLSITFPLASLGQEDAPLSAYESLVGRQEGLSPAALEKLKLLAEQGDANAQNTLGIKYYDGFELSQNYVEAARLFRLAAEQGDAKSQNLLGQMHTDGKGVLQDYVA